MSFQFKLIVIVLVTSAGCSHNKPTAIAPEKVTESNVPAAVRDAIHARFPAATVSSIERENEQGNVVYDYELRQGGRKFESDVKADGTIMEVEKQLMTGEVPPSVTQAVQEKYPRATITEVMEVNKVSGKQETPDHYEATITPAGGKEMEVTVSLDGKIQEEPAVEK